LPKMPRITAAQAEHMLLQAGFRLLRTAGSHRIYFRTGTRVIVPHHAGKTLHPKIVKQVLKAIEFTA
jgi:predicted RNA binding protein YcfA (HicA-like mRNA interferase family)